MEVVEWIVHLHLIFHFVVLTKFSRVFVQCYEITNFQLYLVSILIRLKKGVLIFRTLDI